MRTKLCVFAVLGVLAAVLVPAASANSTVIDRFPDLEYSITQTGICPSPIDLTASLTNISRTMLFDNTGTKTATHWRWFEQDTWSGPTGTLVGERYTVEEFLTFDSEGNVVSAYNVGQTAKTWLPDGHLFMSVGRTNDLGHDFIFLPDTGHYGDLDAFCAALGA